MADERDVRFTAAELTPSELAAYKKIWAAPRDPHLLRDFEPGAERDSVLSLQRKGAIHINGKKRVSLTRKGEPGFTLPRRSRRAPPSGELKSVAAVGLLAAGLVMASSYCCICLVEGRHEWHGHSVFDHWKHATPGTEVASTQGEHSE